MEPKFQTSFIPKRQIPSAVPGSPGISSPKHRGASLYMTFAVLVFVASLAAVGGAYAWKQYLLSSQEGQKQALADREKQFNLDLIQQLKQVNVKIDYAKTLLRNHLALSSIFDVLGRMTIGHVRFMSLDLTAPNSQSPDMKVAMHGYGTSLQAVAFQSDVLSSLEQYGLRNVVKNPMLTDPALDASNGTVAFGFTASINPSALSYDASIAGIQPGSQSASSTPSGSSSGTSGSQ